MASRAPAAENEYFVPTATEGCDELCLRGYTQCEPTIVRGTSIRGSRYSQEDFEACVDPENTPGWMWWMNCIEITGFYEKDGQTVSVEALHSSLHASVGEDLLDTSTSPTDPLFYPYHAHIIGSAMQWVANMGSNDLLYPSSQTDQIDVTSANSGPFSTYHSNACEGDTTTFPLYDSELAWQSGTLLNDVVHSGFPFKNLFESNDGGEDGYTYAEIIDLALRPENSEYTYDFLQVSSGDDDDDDDDDDETDETDDENDNSDSNSDSADAEANSFESAFDDPVVLGIFVGSASLSILVVSSALIYVKQLKKNAVVALAEP